MAEAVGNDLLGNGVKRTGDSQIEIFEGSGLAFRQVLFDNGPTRLNGIEVWRVGRQVEHLGTGLLDGLGNALHFVGRQVIHHNNLSCPRVWAKHIADIGQKNLSIGGRGDCHCCLPTLATDGSQYGHRWPMPTWGCLADSLAAFSPAVAPGHIRSHPTLIQKDETVCGNSSDPFVRGATLLLAAFCVLLRGVKAFFPVQSHFQQHGAQSLNADGNLLLQPGFQLKQCRVWKLPAS